MRAVAFESAAGFLSQAEPILRGDEARTSLMYGIVRRLAEGGRYGDEPPVLVCVLAGEEIVALATRTPPYHLIIHAVDLGRDAIPTLVEFLRRRDPDLPGVHAEKEIARQFAEAWTEGHGRNHHVSMEQRLYRLDEVAAVPASPGEFRLAAPADRDLLAAWVCSFITEATPGDSHPDPLAFVDRHIEAGTLGVWDHGGPRTMAAITRGTPRGVAVSLVFTPPESRRQGYASSCVAALSQRQLDAGKSFCTLFTDLSNPTSNAIYQRIGYRPLADITRIDFAS